MHWVREKKIINKLFWFVSLINSLSKPINNESKISLYSLNRYSKGVSELLIVCSNIDLYKISLQFSPKASNNKIKEFNILEE